MSASGKSAEYLLDSGALHIFLVLDWCWKKNLKVKNGESFGVRLEDRLEIPAVGKVHFFINLGPMKTV